MKLLVYLCKIPQKSNILADYLISREDPDVFMQNPASSPSNPGFYMRREFNFYFKALN